MTSNIINMFLIKNALITESAVYFEVPLKYAMSRTVKVVVSIERHERGRQFHTLGRNRARGKQKGCWKEANSIER